MEAAPPSSPREDDAVVQRCPLHPDVRLEQRDCDACLFLCRADLWEAGDLMLAMCPERDVASLILWRGRMDARLNPVPFGCFTQRGLLCFFTSTFREPNEYPMPSEAMSVFVDMLDAVVDFFWSRWELQNDKTKYPYCSEHTPTALACSSCVSTHPYYDGAQ